MGESVTTPLAPNEPQVPLQVQPGGMGSADALLVSPGIRTAKQSKESVRYFELKRKFIRSYLLEKICKTELRAYRASAGDLSHEQTTRPTAGWLLLGDYRLVRRTRVPKGGLSLNELNSIFATQRLIDGFSL